MVHSIDAKLVQAITAYLCPCWTIQSKQGGFGRLTSVPDKLKGKKWATGQSRMGRPIAVIRPKYEPTGLEIVLLPHFIRSSPPTQAQLQLISKMLPRGNMHCLNQQLHSSPCRNRHLLERTNHAWVRHIHTMQRILQQSASCETWIRHLSRNCTLLPQQPPLVQVGRLTLSS